jgi:hypothetical protein
MSSFHLREIAPTDAPWLLSRASVQRESDPAPVTPHYDDARQMSYASETTDELAIDASFGVGTKKADRETGEDQKGF